MTALSPAQLVALVRRHESDPVLVRIVAAAALAESGGDTEARGDVINLQPTSLGLWQINDIHGLSAAARLDPDQACDWMLQNEFRRCYQSGLLYGYPGEKLARYVCMAAERPFGWNGPSDPGLDSAAADRYAAAWNRLAGVLQPGPPPVKPAPCQSLAQALQDERSYSSAVLAHCVRPALEMLRRTPPEVQGAINALRLAEEAPA